MTDLLIQIHAPLDGDVDSDPESLPAGTTGARSPRGGRALP